MNGIVLIGEPGSGKSTIANALSEKLGWHRLSFAAPLKNEVASLLTMDRYRNKLDAMLDETARAYYLQIIEEMNDPNTKDLYRGILQWWGTQWRRLERDDYWIKQLEYSWNKLIVNQFELPPRIVVDDCRFDNEWEMLHDRGCVLVSLESGETTRPVQAHESEIDWHRWTADLILSYERGPEHQADRIIEHFGLVYQTQRIDV